MQIQASKETDRILPALAKVQMRIPVIEAAQKADIPTRTGGRMQYAYANLADVWRQVKPILQEHGLVLAHPVRSEDGACYLQTILWHAESGQWLGSEIPLDVKEKDSRPVGARISFMRRYCSLALLAIPTSDDDEARHFAELQRAERREEARARKEALTEGRTHRGPSTGRPVSEPPPESGPPEPPRHEEPPPPVEEPRQTPPQAAQTAPPQGPPPPAAERSAASAHAPTVDQLVQMILAEKKRNGDHPAWVIDAIASAVGCERDRCVSKRNLTALVSEHPEAAIELGRRLVEADRAAGEGVA